MASLTPDGEDLVEAGRAVLRATGGDLERIQGVLAQRLGPGAFSSAAPVASHGVLLKLALVAAVATGLGGGAVLLSRSTERDSVPERPLVGAAPAPPGQSALNSGAPAVVAPDLVPLRRPEPAQSSKVSPRPATAEGTLAEEVALLSRASSAFRAGRPAETLEILAQHQRHFPNGALSQERAAARIQALCALGRSKQAEAELERFIKAWPSSPLEARARRSCGLAPVK